MDSNMKLERRILNISFLGSLLFLVAEIVISVITNSHAIFMDCIYDVFDLLIKVAAIQWQKEYDLNAAVRYIAIKFGIAGYSELTEQDTLIDDSTVEEIEVLEEEPILKKNKVNLKEIDDRLMTIDDFLE